MYQGKLSPFWGTLATCPIVDKLHSCCWNTELTEASAALMWSCTKGMTDFVTHWILTWTGKRIERLLGFVVQRPSKEVCIYIYNFTGLHHNLRISLEQNQRILPLPSKIGPAFFNQSCWISPSHLRSTPPTKNTVHPNWGPMVLPTNQHGPQQMEVWKMISLFHWVIFCFHVNFPGCISKKIWPII